MRERLAHSVARPLLITVALALAVALLAIVPAEAEPRAQGGDAAPEAAGPPDHVIEVAPEVAERARSRAPEAFGGVWFEGDRMVVAATEGAQALANSATRGLDIAADAATVDFSLAELENTQSELNAVAEDLADWNSFAVHTSENRVVVNASDAEAVEAELLDIVSDPATVEVVEGESYEPLCTRADCTGGPIRAGLEIWMPNSGSRCTMAFSATYRGRQGVLTAGHCLSSGERAAHSNYWFGTAGTSHFYNGSRADAVFVTMDSGWPNATNWVYRTNWDKTHTISSVGNGGWVGQRVCFAGRTTNGEVCGLIRQTGATINYGRVTLYDQHIFEGCAQPGDSGSPVYTLGGTAQGVLSGGSSNPCNTVIYSPIDNVQSATGASVKTSP